MAEKNLGFVKSIFVSITPPTNINAIWFDDNTDQKMHKYYDIIESAWLPLKGSAIIQSHDLGWFADEASLVSAYPTAEAGDFATNLDTETIWYWNSENNDWEDSGIDMSSSKTFVPNNEIYINVNDNEVFGKQYKSFAHALSFLGTVTLNSKNQWSIHFSGHHNENITLPEFVSLVGENEQTSFINSTVFFNYTSGQDDISCYNRIKDCRVSDISLKGQNVFLENVILKIIKTSGTSGFMANNSVILDGDFIACNNVCLIKNSEIHGGTYPSNLEIDGGTLEKCSLNGGTFKNMEYIDLHGGLCNEANYNFYLSHISAFSFSFSHKYVVNFKNCVSDGLIAGNFVQFKIYNSTGDFSTTGSGGITVMGHFYDNGNAFLSSNDSQGAIDELANVLSTGQGINGSFVIGGQTFTITNGLITSIV